MSVNVGLVTGTGAPISATKPLTNCVFPAPSGPTNATTAPTRKSRANSRPAFSVAAGLSEVHVTTGKFSIFEFRLSIEPADPGETNVREFFLPTGGQQAGVSRGN